MRLDLMFTRARYGNFTIWHPEAQLCLMDLHNGNAIRELAMPEAGYAGIEFFDFSLFADQSAALLSAHMGHHGLCRIVLRETVAVYALVAEIFVFKHRCLAVEHDAQEYQTEIGRCGQAPNIILRSEDSAVEIPLKKWRTLLWQFMHWSPKSLFSSTGVWR